MMEGTRDDGESRPDFATSASGETFQDFELRTAVERVTSEVRTELAKITCVPPSLIETLDLLVATINMNHPKATYALVAEAIVRRVLTAEAK